MKEYGTKQGLKKKLFRLWKSIEKIELNRATFTSEIGEVNNFEFPSLDSREPARIYAKTRLIRVQEMNTLFEHYVSFVVTLRLTVFLYVDGKSDNSCAWLVAHQTCRMTRSRTVKMVSRNLTTKLATTFCRREAWSKY